MNTFGITERSYHLIQDAFQKYPEILKVYIYGSRARGDHRTGSDIDLALLGDKVNTQIAFQLRVLLNEELPIPYYIDVVSYPDLNQSALKSEIDRDGKEFYHQSQTSTSFLN